MPTVITQNIWRAQRSEIRPDSQGRFALPDEDVGGGAQRLDPADPGDPFEAATDPADHQLHDAEVVKDRDQRGEEHDRGQRRDGKAVATDGGIGKRAE